MPIRSLINVSENPGEPCVVTGKDENAEAGMGLPLAENIVEIALKAGADESECFLEWGTGYGYTVEGGNLKRVSGGVTAGFGLRVIKDGRMGFVYSASFDDLISAAESAIRLTKISPERDFSFPEPAPCTNVAGLYDGRVREMDVEDMCSMMEEMLAGAKDVSEEVRVTHGGGGFGWGASAMVNSRGLKREERGTGVSLYASCVVEGKGISSAGASVESNGLDVECGAVGREAAYQALRGQGARSAPGGEMDVLFVNEAAWEMFDNAVLPAFQGPDERKGRTYIHGKLGSAIAPEWFSLLDDPLMASGLGSGASDDEGTPSRTVALIDNGSAKSVLFDHFSAMKHDVEPTSSGLRSARLSGDRSYRHPPTTQARNIRVEAECVASFRETVEEMRRGMVVHDVLGAHTANRVSGDFSVNSSRLFYVENGEIVHPVTSAMISGNALRLLMGIETVCDDPKHMSGGMGASAAFMPSLLIRGLRIT